MTPEEAGAYLRRSDKTLRNWRVAGTGPRYVRIGGKDVFYRLPDLDDFINDSIVVPDGSAWPPVERRTSKKAGAP